MTENAVNLEHVYKVFPAVSEELKPVLALNDVSFTVKKGSLTVISGANGSGKSVLMQIVSGLMRASDGKVYTSSKPGLVFQDAASQILGDTPREDVATGPRNAGVPKKQIAPLVEKALNEVSLLSKADVPADFLSGGEKRRLAVAAIRAMDRDIIIFDEPYANLDYPGVKEVNALITELHKKGRTIILLTHELEKCLALSDHFAVLHKGSLVFDGTADEALNMPLESWGIHNPLSAYNRLEDLVWRS